MDLVGVEGIRDSCEADQWGHLTIAVEVDAEIDVVGIEIDRTRKSGRITKSGLKHTVRHGHTLGFPPNRIIVRSGCTRACRTSGRVQTEQKRIAPVGDVGPVGIDDFPLKVDLFVYAGRSFNRRNERESAHEKHECYQRVHRFPSPSAKHNFYFRKKKTDAGFPATRLLYISLL